MNIYDDYLELVQSAKLHLQESSESWIFSSPEVLDHFRLTYRPPKSAPLEKGKTLPKSLPLKKRIEPAAPPPPKKVEEPKKEWELTPLTQEKYDLQPILNWLKKEAPSFHIKASPLPYTPLERVLILTSPLSDEEKAFLTKIAEALMARGAPTEIHTTQTEQEALEYCQKEKWRLVLSSWPLPQTTFPLEMPLTWMGDTTKKKALWSHLCQKLQIK